MVDRRSKPVFSVVTVTRNDLDGLIRTSDSVEDQRYDRVQHVVVDASTQESTRNWLKADGVNAWREWVSEPDRGIYDGMNKGIRLAKGDIVVFMNSGDTFTDSEVLPFVADQWQSAEWEWGYGAARIVDRYERVIYGHMPLNLPPSKFSQGLSTIPHQSTFMSLPLIRGLGGFKEDCGTIADQDLMLRAMIRQSPARWVRFLSDYRLGGASSNVTAIKKEFLWRRMRKSNGLLVGGNRTIDLVATFGLAAYRQGRSWTKGASG